MMDELQVVREARALLDDPGNDYRFGDWSRCACGFLYRAAEGRWADDVAVVVAEPAPGSRYARALDVVVDALGGHFLSRATALSHMAAAEGSPAVKRRQAALVFDRAIGALERRVMDEQSAMPEPAVEPAARELVGV